MGGTDGLSEEGQVGDAGKVGPYGEFDEPSLAEEVLSVLLTCALVRVEDEEEEFLDHLVDDGQGGEAKQQGDGQLDVFYPLDGLDHPFGGELYGHVEDLEQLRVIEGEGIGTA
jgi:hypothetical protein